MSQISAIAESLYSPTPTDTLYHYTSFSGMMGVVRSAKLWASDIRYMNDSSELRHAADLIRQEVKHRIADGHPQPDLLSAFHDWFANRIANGHMLYASSFRSNGNLLSQWRGYSQVGKGVSVGFDAKRICTYADDQRFQVGKCVYHPQRQRALIAEVVDEVEQSAGAMEIETTTKNLELIFETLESELLRIAALLKHPSFEEEEEWRLVSPVFTDFMSAEIKFREGTSMLVPYIEFKLTSAVQPTLAFEHLFLGPTPNISQSMNSLNLFLQKHGIRPERGIDYCQIPFRHR